MTSARRMGLAVVAIGAAAATSCFIPTEGSVAQLTFHSLPGPGVVVGDTLRDSLGVAAPLTADITIGRTVRFVPLDTNIRVDANGFLTARSRDTSASATNIVRVIADGDGSLQTFPRLLTVTVRPDEVVRHGTAPGELAYDPTLTGVAADTINRSATLQVRLRHLFVAGEAGAVARDTVARAIRVRYEIASFGSNLDSARLVDDARNPARFDTTDSQGLASRRVQVYPKIGATSIDSVVVLARVYHRGAQVTGSPVRFVVPLRRRS